MNILFLGGDLRQRYACNYLNKNKYSAKEFLDFNIKDIDNELLSADVIALPIPASRDGVHLNMPQGADEKVTINDILERIRENTVVIGAKLTQKVKEVALNRSITTLDYMDIEPFQIKNALLSAEGAIYYAKQKIERSIHGLEILIFGCGRIGKILAYLLSAHGAKVTVIARRDIDLTWSSLIGYGTLKIPRNTLTIKSKPDIIFNTIPYQIIDEKFLNWIDNDTVIIDLASFPYGVDEELIKKYNLNYHHELGIPGRYAPQSAGEIIGQTIIDYVLVREDLH